MGGRPKAGGEAHAVKDFSSRSAAPARSTERAVDDARAMTSGGVRASGLEEDILGGAARGVVDGVSKRRRVSAVETSVGHDRWGRGMSASTSWGVLYQCCTRTIAVSRGREPQSARRAGRCLGSVRVGVASALQATSVQVRRRSDRWRDGGRAKRES